MDIYKGEVRAYKKCGKCHLGAVMIESEGYDEKKYGQITFQHRKHEKTYLNQEKKRILCADCHHEYKDGKNIWKEGDRVKKCGAGDCHDPLKTVGKKQYKLRIAYHKNCKECHKTIKKVDNSKDAPYKKCSGCMKSQ